MNTRLLAFVALWALLVGCGEPDSRTEPGAQATASQLNRAASAVELTPPHWHEGMVERFLEYHNTFETERALVTGERFLIAGLQSALGVGAGYQALLEGANAMDAALTAAIAQTVVQGGYGVSFAGWLALLYFDAETGGVHALNAGYNTLLEEHDPLSIPHYADGSGARAVLVPGFMAGMAAAHGRFGSLPWPALFEPGIWFARQGIAVPERLANTIQWKKELIAVRPEAAALFMPDGKYLDKGDQFRQPELAETLTRVAASGPDYMYRGEWAERFVAALRREGSAMTMADLARYEPTWAEPWETRFAGFRVLGPGPPAYGGYQVLEGLNLIEAAGIAEHGHYAASPEALASFMRLSRAAGFLETQSAHNFGAGHGALITDYFPDIHPTPAARITRKHAERVWTAMGSPRWQEFADAVIERERGEILEIQRMLEDMDKPQRSDTVIAVDEAGNVAVLLHTINTLAWGYGLFVDGVSIPDSGSFQQKLIAEVGPGNRVPETGQPIIVLDSGGRPVLASNTAGSWLPGATIQFLFNALAMGMDPARAINTAQFWRPELIDGKVTQQVGRGDFEPALLDAVRDLGVPVAVLDEAEHYGQSSYVIGVAIDHEAGSLSGGIPKAFNGIVAAQ